MINRSEIIKRAWGMYRLQFRFGDIVSPFGVFLREAWNNAKRQMREAEAMALAGPNGPRIASIKNSIAELQYKPFRYSIADKRRALEAELRMLQAA